LQLAIRHPELLNKIIVASTMYNKAGAFPGFWDMMKEARFDGMPRPYADAYLQIVPDKDALYTMFQRDVKRMQTFKDIPEKDIEAIQTPALILSGDHDVNTVEHAVQMFRKLKQAQLAIFPGGHGDYMGEITTMKPGQTEFAALPAILAFLASR
jgi:pimeloyl-ACP methyl ester carboxylesterase